MLFQSAVHVPAEACFEKINFFSLKNTQKGGVVGIQLFDGFIGGVAVFYAGGGIGNFTDAAVARQDFIGGNLLFGIRLWLGGSFVLQIQNDVFVNFGCGDKRFIAEEENIAVKVGSALLRRGDIVHIEHDDILIFKIEKIFVGQPAAGNFYPVYFGRVDKGRSEGNNLTAGKIGAVELVRV